MGSQVGDALMEVDAEKGRVLNGNLKKIAGEGQCDEVCDGQGDAKDEEFLGL